MKEFEIIPAIMPNSYEDLQEKALSVAGAVQWVQVDVMDGIFVDSESWPYSAENLIGFQDMVKNGEKLPQLDILNYEIDLMTEHPEDEIPKWKTLGARRFVVHFESIESVDVLEHIILTYRKKGESEVGIAIGIDTPVELIKPILQGVDCVQLMGIRRIGYQGEAFASEVIDRVRRLRDVYKGGIISVDGGVSLKTAPRLLEAGVDRLVSGSAIYSSNDIVQAVRDFKNL